MIGEMHRGGSIEYLTVAGQFDLGVELELNVTGDALVVDVGAALT